MKRSYNHNENPSWDPDALVDFKLYPTEKLSREKPVANGYCPHYKIKEDYLTSTKHFFIDKELLHPGESIEAFVKFITPEVYPKTLWKGRSIIVHEASKIIGEATIIEVYNEELKGKD